MKALSLHQPWASLIAVGAKRIETRSWPTRYRGPLAIHAAKRYDRHQKTFAIGTAFDALTGAGITNVVTRVPLGAIVATCELVDCVRILRRGDAVGSRRRYCALDEHDQVHVWHVLGRDAGEQDGFYAAPNEAKFGDYTPYRYAWLLDHVHAVNPPAPARGAQGLWEWSPGPDDELGWRAYQESADRALFEGRDHP